MRNFREKGCDFTKGSPANFGASATFDAALRLEMMGKDGELGGAEAVYSFLAEEMERMGKALEIFAGGDNL